MTYRFSLYDEQDPFEGLGTQTYAPPPTAAAHMQPQRDPELDAAWRERELAELEASKGSEYGFGEGVRDVLPALLALGVDAAFNKGRGAGGILQGTAQVAAQGEALRDAKRRAAGESALKIHQRDKGYVDPDYRWAALGQRRDAADAVQARSDRSRNDKIDPNSQLRATEQAQAFEKARQSAMGTQEGQHAYAPTRADDQALIAGAEAGARTQANIDTELQNAPRVNENAADKARVVEEAQLPARQALKQTPTPSEQRATAQAELAHTPIPGTTIVDEQAYRAAAPDPVRREKIATYARGAQVAAEAMEDMARLRRQVKAAWNGLDDETKRRAIGEIAAKQKIAIGGISTVANTGVLNNGEFPRYAADLADGSLALSDFSDVALEGLGFGARDTQLERMEGTLQAFRDAAQRGLSVAGLQMGEIPGLAAPQPAAAAAATPQPAPPDVNPFAGAEQLPVTQGKVPPIGVGTDDWRKRYEKYRIGAGQ